MRSILLTFLLPACLATYHGTAVSATFSNDGSYQFAYDTGNVGGHQYRQEVRDPTGAVVGHYAYRDPTGYYRQVNYRADNLGFRTAAAYPVYVYPVVRRLEDDQQTEVGSRDEQQDQQHQWWDRKQERDQQQRDSEQQERDQQRQWWDRKQERDQQQQDSEQQERDQEEHQKWYLEQQERDQQQQQKSDSEAKKGWEQWSEEQQQQNPQQDTNVTARDNQGKGQDPNLFFQFPPFFQRRRLPDTPVVVAKPAQPVSVVYQPTLQGGRTASHVVYPWHWSSVPGYAPWYYWYSSDKAGVPVYAYSQKNPHTAYGYSYNY